jgi:hypothetical protein
MLDNLEHHILAIPVGNAGDVGEADESDAPLHDRRDHVSKLRRVAEQGRADLPVRLRMGADKRDVTARDGPVRDRSPARDIVPPAGSCALAHVGVADRGRDLEHKVATDDSAERGEEE